ncbi:MAG: hypothetical protein JWL59_4934 [Chthoniobacteraceae bacterium]|nr:hypothetical protein [Chthoniobacteraceae bacterium]
MKNTILSLVVGITAASSAFAGTEVSHKDFKSPAPLPEPCFRDTEFQFDTFGSFTDNSHHSIYRDGWGGGVSLNVFFARYFGLSAEGNVYDGGANGVWNPDARLIVRYPIEGGAFCWAPYIFGGGGAQFDGTSSGSWHVGSGAEWRVTREFGIFYEGRYTWTAQSNDAAQYRLGVRFTF